MSAVLDFFRDNPIPTDETHKILAKIPAYEAQLPPIRQRMLSCCGAFQGENGKIELVVADLTTWSELSEEQAAITSRIDAINNAVAELDKIFAEVEAAGVEIRRKTVSGIWNSVPRTEPPATRGEYRDWSGRRVGQDGRPLKSTEDPGFLAWAQRAENAFKGL